MGFGKTTPMLLLSLSMILSGCAKRPALVLLPDSDGVRILHKGEPAPWDETIAMQKGTYLRIFKGCAEQLIR